MSLIVLQQFLTSLSDARRKFSDGLKKIPYKVAQVSIGQSIIGYTHTSQQHIYPTAQQNHGFPYDFLYSSHINLVTRSVGQSPCLGSFCVLFAFIEHSIIKEIHSLQDICIRMNWLVVLILPSLE